MPEIDPYLAMGPLRAAGEPPAPPALPAAPEDTDGLDDEVMDESLADGAPDEADDAADGAADVEDEGEGDDDGGDEEPDDRAWLIERARKADELEQLLARQSMEQREKEAMGFWEDRRAQADEHFAKREALIYQQAEKNLNPVGYLREKLAELNAEATVWYDEFETNYDQAKREFEWAKALPQFAARVVEHYKLPKEAVNDLLDYPPDQMEREAQRMRARLIKERKQQKEIDQLKRRAARLEQERNPLNTGTGRGSAVATSNFAPGSTEAADALYLSMPWQRR